jgi:hypothetical protein
MERPIDGIERGVCGIEEPITKREPIPWVHDAQQDRDQVNERVIEQRGLEPRAEIVVAATADRTPGVENPIRLRSASHR